MTRDKSWKYDPYGCGPSHHTIFITVFKQPKLVENPCLNLRIEAFEEYDRWLLQSFYPPFSSLTNDYYSIFDENPHNIQGEIHFYIGCQSNLSWFVQLSIDDDWREWNTGGQSSNALGNRFFIPRIDPNSGKEIIEELRTFTLLFAMDANQFIPKDKNSNGIVQNISIRISNMDESASSTYIINVVRLPDLITIPPQLLHPRAGAVEPTGFLLSFYISEDAYPESLKLLIKPRESKKYPTDENDVRIIQFDDSSWVCIICVCFSVMSLFLCHIFRLEMQKLYIR